MPEPQPSRPPLPWWIAAIVIVCALLMAIGAILALVNPAQLTGPHDAVNGAVRIYAGYLFSRNLSIAIMLIALLIAGARRTLSSIMVLTAVVQILDAILDATESRWPLVPGVLFLAIILLLGARRLASHSTSAIDSGQIPAQK